MPFVPVPATVQVNIRGTYLGEQVENTLYFETAPATTPAFVQSVADNAAVWWRTSVLPLLAADYVFREAYAVDLTTETSSTATATLGAGDDGGQTAPGLPGNVALCLSFRTQQRGRSFRGRNYICGLTEAQVVGNFITPGAIPAFVNAYSELLEAGNVVPGVWVVASRFGGGQRRLIGLTTPVTAVVVTDNYVDSMRRRLPGRGR